MKKNKMMRIAAVLLIVTLLSTCAISGTFAKYVTRTDGEDSARVAKWGITIEVENNKLFSDVYPTHDQNGYTGTYSVAAYNTQQDSDKEFIPDTGDKLVAPGTSSNDIENGGFVAHVYGKPEVATRFALKLCSLEDVFLPEGEGYTDYTTAVAADPADQATFDLEYPDPGTTGDYIKGYSPVKWDVTVSKYTGTTARLSTIAKEVASTFPGKIGKMAEMLVADNGISITDAETIVSEVKKQPSLKQKLLDQISAKFRSLDIDNLQIIIEDMDGDGKDDVILSLDFAPNQEVNYDFALEWAWDFEQAAPQFVLDDAADADEEAAIKAEWVDLFDKCDTYIGNVAAGVIDDDACTTNIKFNWEASATQID